MAEEYWDRYWKERRSRRRFLGGAVATGAGAAGLALVGCGDDDDDDDTEPTSAATTPAGTQAGATTPASNATPTPADPYAGAKRGGVYRMDQAGDPPTIDPYGNASFLTKGFAAYNYSRLFKYNAGMGVKRRELQPVGDLAESSEASPDGLVWTVKLRKDAKFHNVAPVNGRAVTTDDVKFSWGRATAEANTNRTQLSFIDKVEYPDLTTVKFTLKSPNAAFLDVLADANLVWIMPKESDGGFNPAQQAIGSGPWLFESYQPSVSIKHKKNPDWHVKGFPLMDAVESAIIPEYANRLAQFQAGNTDVSGITAEDIVAVKKAMPNIQLWGDVAQQLSFIFFDPDPASPWAKDPRVKQAVSMAQDRDGMMDLAYNVKKLKSEGLDVSARWNNIIPAGMERFWLDPKSSAQGDSKKFFEYNVKEAKALMAAAGFASGFEAIYQYTANRYGAAFNAVAEAVIGFLNELGIKTTTEVQDYSSKYFTQTFAGNFKGIAYGLETPFPEGGSYPVRLFTDNPLNHSRIVDPELADLAAKQQRELDPAKRKEIFAEIQRKNAAKMHYIPHVIGAGTTWSGFQGWVKNVDVQTFGYGAGTETVPFRWFNK
ncbi:MAG TPA: ABC transporter substrate-binding protein [Tepidiformaceae bacterium]|nr:ABC transporter substrate-binding protein [Tepidiformaceae bacterium]